MSNDKTVTFCLNTKGIYHGRKQAISREQPGVTVMQKNKASQGYREWHKEAALTSSKRLERNGANQILQGRGSPAEGAA